MITRIGRLWQENSDRFYQDDDSDLLWFEKIIYHLLYVGTIFLVPMNGVNMLVSVKNMCFDYSLDARILYTNLRL